MAIDTKRTIVFCFVAFLFAIKLPAQDSCPALNIAHIVPGTNMFSPQQEVYLAEAIDASMQLDHVIIRDPALTGRMQAIVDRMARVLPSDHPQFKVALMELPTANAYSTIGGHIYVSPKLVAMVGNDDELAGVLGHEMGHLAAEHIAVSVSDGFRAVLGAKQVGDRKDVIDKWNELHNNWHRMHMSQGDVTHAEKIHEQEELQADAIGLYLVARAGYSTNSFGEFFDRLAETKGKTGGFWSDLFGETSQDSKRLREMVRSATPMPPSCVTRGEIAGNFTNWKNSVVEYKQPVGEEALPGLYSKRVLAQHLTPEIHRIRISPDGRYVLAQDENNIFVLTRQPLKPVFQFEAPGATGAKFTPDSQDVVFTMGGFGESPRVEKWNIASQKRSEVHEIHVAKGCLTHAVSPDGKTLACTTDATNEYAFKLDLDLYDTGTATSYWHKSDWVAITSSYDLYFRQQLYFNLLAQNEAYFSNLSRLRFSADGHYLLAHSPNNTLCMDLFNRVTVSLPNEVKSAVSQGVFTFVGQDKLVGMNDYTNWTAELIQFPSGRLFAKNIQIGRADVLAVAHGDFILLSPLKDNPLGVLDLRSQTLALASKRITLDIWDDQYIAEQLDGTLQVFDLKTAKPLETAHLPEAPIPKLTAADVSPDLKWLAISHKTRGAVWNLETGEQTYKVRGFRGVYFDPDNGIYADFPKFAQTDRTIVRMPLPKQAIEAKRTLTDKEHARQFGKYLLKFVPAKENNPNSRDVTVEIHDIHDDQLLWSKRFPQGPPDGWITSETRSLILHWPAGSKPIKALAKDDQDAASKLAPYHDKAGIVFLQVIALDTGKVQSQMAIDTGKNSFTPKGISVSANRVVLFDNENRVLVYSLDGKPLSVFQGRGYSISSTALLVQEEAQSRQAALYDLSTLEKRAVYRFSSPVVFSSFSADGKRMLVLTNDQTVYTFEISTETEAQGKPTTG